jgi:hypothetical protein
LLQDAFCYTIVIANGKELPAQITSQISGLELPPTARADIAWPGSCNEPGSCWPLQRIFGGNYALNFTRDAASGNWSFTDLIGATSTNVYRLGNKTPSFEPFIDTNDDFTKTGSGQT